jgi:hypothetical protein
VYEHTKSHIIPPLKAHQKDYESAKIPTLFTFSLALLAINPIPKSHTRKTNRQANKGKQQQLNKQNVLGRNFFSKHCAPKLGARRKKGREIKVCGVRRKQKEALLVSAQHTHICPRNTERENSASTLNKRSALTFAQQKIKWAAWKWERVRVHAPPIIPSTH